MTILTIKKWILLSGIALVSACSTTQWTQLQNLQLFLSSKESVALSNAEVLASPVDLAYVQRGDKPIVTVGLAFIENNKYKWVSNDNAIIETLKGRITRISGTPQSLVHVSNVDFDPISDLSHPDRNSLSYDRTIDTISDGLQNYGASLSSSFSQSKEALITINGNEYSVVQIVETVQYQDVFHGEHTWTNHFYFHSESDQLLQSTQTIAPNIETLKIQYISRALRLLSDDEVEAAN